MNFTTHGKSEQIEEYIRKKMLPALKPDAQLPSEMSLAKQLGTSCPTIHKILSNLTSQGVLYRRNGVGTFVSKPQVKKDTIVAVLAHPSNTLPSQNCNWFVEQFMVGGLIERAAKDEVSVQLAHMHPDERSYDETVSLLLNLRASAYFFLELGGYSEIVRRLSSAGGLCIVRSPAPCDFAHCVYRRIKEGVEKGVELLAASGCRKIAYFGSEPEVCIFEELRLEGYRNALANASIPVDETLIRFCGGFPQDGASEVNAMLAEGLKFDAIFAGTDLRAIGAMQALNIAKLRIPEDVSVLGSDNLPECLLQNPQLSTVSFDYPELGEAMYEVMLEALSCRKPGFICRGMDSPVLMRGTTRS